MNYVTFWLANVISIVSSSPYFLTVKKKKKETLNRNLEKAKNYWPFCTLTNMLLTS